MPGDNASAVGTVFDIKQLAVYDGPGIRTTVFLKGCPLRCMWCHNPEGLSYQPQLMVSSNNCLHCGACIRACPNGGKTCTACGRCIRACPQGLRKLCGKRYTAQELAQKLLRDKDYLAAMSGGVTFSGGEPTGQPEFLLETLDRVAGMHRAIETSGYCSGSVFEAVLARVEYVMMDLKLMDPEQHRHYTGVSNEPILENLERLKKSGRPFRIRIPVIPGVNDSEENFGAAARRLLDADDLEQVELLPYDGGCEIRDGRPFLSARIRHRRRTEPEHGTLSPLWAEVYPSVGQRHICTEDRSAGIIKNCAEAFLLRSFCV